MKLKLKNGAIRHVVAGGRIGASRIQSVELDSKDVADLARLGEKAAEYLEVLSTRMASLAEE